MIINKILSIIGLLSFISMSLSAAPPLTSTGITDTGGDNPLTTSYIWQGRGGVEVAALAIDGLSNPSGTVVEDSIPNNSTVIYAYFATMGWHRSILPASAVFNGHQLPSVQPAANDSTPDYQLSFYKWDVTSMVTGNGSYSFSLFNLSQCYVAFLVIVYENAEMPTVLAVVNDGSEALQQASSTTAFTGLPPGNGLIKILTQAGNIGQTGESISFNGQLLAGPGDIFCCNIGDHADYFEFNQTNVIGNDSLTLTTGSDFIGIHLALLMGGAEPISVTLTPHNPPIRVPSSGGNIAFDASIENNSDSTIIFDAWTEVILPNSVIYGPLILRSNVVISSSLVLMRQVSQFVPGPAFPGLYYYVGRVGTYPDVIFDADSFSFVKMYWGSADHQNSSWSCCGWFDDETSTSVPVESAIINAYPNPFNAATAISFELGDAGLIKLAVYDIAGREVITLAEGWMSNGIHETTFDGTELSSGIYFARLTSEEECFTQKLLLVK